MRALRTLSIILAASLVYLQPQTTRADENVALVADQAMEAMSCWWICLESSPCGSRRALLDFAIDSARNAIKSYRADPDAALSGMPRDFSYLLGIFSDQSPDFIIGYLFSAQMYGVLQEIKSWREKLQARNEKADVRHSNNAADLVFAEHKCELMSQLAITHQGRLKGESPRKTPSVRQESRVSSLPPIH